MQYLDTRHALVFALAHELGNQLAGIRLEAHLLDEGLGPAELARASLAIDGLAAQAVPLLSLLRPLLSPTARRASAPACAAVLESLRRELELEGIRGRPIALELAEDADRGAPAIDGLAALLRALIGTPVELGAAGEPIRLGLTRAPGGVAVTCELPGEVLSEAVDAGGRPDGAGRPGQTPVHGLRGRSLACAIARVLVADVGGTVDVRVEAGRSRVALHLPLGPV